MGSAFDDDRLRYDSVGLHVLASGRCPHFSDPLPLLADIARLVAVRPEEVDIEALAHMGTGTPSLPLTFRARSGT